MRVGKYLMAAAVASMTVAPAFAAPANSTASLSRSTSVRASGQSDKGSKDSETGIIVGVVALLAVGAGIAAAVSNHDSKPNSP